METVPIIEDLRDIFVGFIFSVFDSLINTLLTALPDVISAILAALGVQ